MNKSKTWIPAFARMTPVSAIAKQSRRGGGEFHGSGWKIIGRLLKNGFPWFDKPLLSEAEGLSMDGQSAIISACIPFALSPSTCS